jgi:orotidine-5'-phosphate decarboxylase
MNYNNIYQNILLKKSFLCVGLDTDLNKIPSEYLQEADPIFAFNKDIIDATLPYTVSYKINTAFYEAQGTAGWNAMEKTIKYIPKDVFIIADAKRGDIGNTSAAYAKTFLQNLPCHAVTVNPYMGADSVQPFITQNKFAIILALTSNKGAEDFEMQTLANGKKLYEQVLETSKQWGNINNLMYVVGATQATELANIRKIIPDHFLLVPGVGFQGGSLQQVADYGMNKSVGLLVNVSRAIIYASEKRENLPTEAAAIAAQYQYEMAELLQKHGKLA